jgi:hypothetical protein
MPLPVRCMLWGRAAARCEMCNAPVSWHPQTKEDVNLAEAAHIIGFSEDGPRGEEELSDELAKDISNLMLLCRLCHKAVDTNKESYPVDRLSRMKFQHEQRVERVTAIGQERESHLLLYGANVGDHSSKVCYRTAAPALTANERYPASTTPLTLGMVNSSFRDLDDQFWEIEAKHLRAVVARDVQPRLRNGDIGHLSIFALAPQPLLTLLGHLLCDINYEAQVYQLHREPPGWIWQTDPESFDYVVEEPRNSTGPPALVLALSATITDDRVFAVLGGDAAIWRITIREPHNDFLKSAHQLRQFRELIRPTLDRIKARHGQETPLCVFPAAPVAIAVELGRVLQPKADMPLRLYDQNNSRGGFVQALDINHVEIGTP